MYHLFGSKPRTFEREGLSQTHGQHPSMTMRMQRLSRWAAALSLIVFGWFFFREPSLDVQMPAPPIPLQPVRWAGGDLKSPPEPTFNGVRQWEAKLPQHDLSQPYPEGQHGRYVKFSTQIGGLGWNNVLNELLVAFGFGSIRIKLTLSRQGCSALILHTIRGDRTFSKIVRTSSIAANHIR
jgi:hypothetical protein